MSSPFTVTQPTVQTVDFGTDTSCTIGLLSGRLVSGVRIVAEACYRRLTTPRGKLVGGEDEANYGLDLMDLIGSVTNKAQVAALPGQIETELLKDERLTSAEVTVTAIAGPAPATTYNIQINGHTDVGPFTLDLAVSGVTIDLLGLQVPQAA